MRKLIVTENMSLDGVVSPLGEWFDPSIDDAELAEFTREQDAQSDGLILGRVTFEEFRSYWPTLDDDPTGVADYLNTVQKHVISRSLTEPGWANTTVHGGDPVSAVSALKQAEGRDLVVTGSVTLVHALLAARLVDEIRVTVYPAVQGEGRRLFPDGPVRHLKPVESRTFANGLAFLAYDPRG